MELQREWLWGRTLAGQCQSQPTLKKDQAGLGHCALDHKVPTLVSR